MSGGLFQLNYHESGLKIQMYINFDTRLPVIEALICYKNFERAIDYFTVVCTKVALEQLNLHNKSSEFYIEIKRVASNLAAIQRPGH